MIQNNQIEPKNGIQVLKELGIPEGALIPLLAALATLTMLPYIAGRDFGPYTIPGVFQGRSFWFLTIVPPLLWVILLVKVFGADRRQLKQAAIRLAIVEVVAVIIAVGSMPVKETQTFKATDLRPGQAKLFNMDLPVIINQQLTVTVTDVTGGTNTFKDVALMICGAGANSTQSIPCSGHHQVSINTPTTFSLKPGAVQISVYNYEKDSSVNPQKPVTVTLEAKYLRRRFW